MKNINMPYNMNIYILSDTGAVLRALDSFQINSQLVWDCLRSHMILAQHNRVQLIWVPEYKGKADSLAKHGSETLFIGPELACSVPVEGVMRASRDWRSRRY
jgi:hypothetical protein